MAKEIDFPPVWLAGFAALGGVIGRVLPVTTPANDVLGAFLIVAGLVLMVAAAVQMMLARTTLIPRREPDALVQGGVFRFSRNPIYLANTLLMIGVGLISGIAWFILFAVAAAFVTQKLAIEREERHLEQRFGKRYRDYRKKVRRWI